MVKNFIILLFKLRPSFPPQLMESSFRIALLQNVVENGIQSKEFVCTNLFATAEFILVLGMHIGEQIANFVLGKLGSNNQYLILV